MTFGKIDNKKIATGLLKQDTTFAIDNLEIIKTWQKNSLTNVLVSDENHEDLKEINQYYEDLKNIYFKRSDSASEQDKNSFLKLLEWFFAIYDSKIILENLGVKWTANLILWKWQIAIEDWNMDALKSVLTFLSINMVSLELLENEIVEWVLIAKTHYYLQKKDYQKILDWLNNWLTQEKIRSLSFETQIDILDAKLTSLYHLNKYQEALELMNKEIPLDVFNYILDSGKIKRLTDREEKIQNQI